VTHQSHPKAQGFAVCSGDVRGQHQWFDRTARLWPVPPVLRVLTARTEQPDQPVLRVPRVLTVLPDLPVLPALSVLPALLVQPVQSGLPVHRDFRAPRAPSRRRASCSRHS